MVLWMIRIEDSIGGMNVFPWILMLFLTLACIAYPAYRIASLLFLKSLKIQSSKSSSMSFTESNGKSPHINVSREQNTATIIPLTVG